MDNNRNSEIKFNNTTQQAPQQEPVSARDAWHYKVRGNSGKGSCADSIPAYVVPKKRGMKPWMIAVIIFGGLVLLGLLGSLTGIGPAGDDSDLSGAAEISEEYVGVLYIEGTIGGTDGQYDHQYVLDAIDGMTWNDDNKGMMLYINTPGGTVYESDEVYLKLQEYKEETGRPVYVYMASQATSGGYYIAAAADRISANRNCWTGSIGVTIGSIFDISELLEDYGITVETIDSGANKSMGSMVEPMTDEQRDILQSLVDDAYDQFVDIVAEGRDMDTDEVRKLADGRIYTARQAEENGLIDLVVDTYDDAVADMDSEFDIGSCEFYDFRYEPEYDFLSSLIRSMDKLSESASGQSDLDVLSELMKENGQIELQYMCEAAK